MTTITNTKQSARLVMCAHSQKEARAAPSKTSRASQPAGVRRASRRHATLLCVAGLWLAQVIALQCSSLALAGESAAGNHTTTATKSGTSSAGAPATVASNKTSSEQQQTQPTDVSSLYVQIPIAEPIEGTRAAGDAQSQQQQLTGVGDDDSGVNSKASAWTGPWPKKFQIGYIKQSDLHQVLIESLKGDSFLGETAPAKAAPASNMGGGASASKSSPASGNKGAPLAAPPSDAASLMAGHQSGATNAQQAAASAFQRLPNVHRSPRVPMKSLYGLAAAQVQQQQQQQHMAQMGAYGQALRGQHSGHFRQPFAPAVHRQQQQAPMLIQQQMLRQQHQQQGPSRLMANFHQAPKALPMTASYLQQPLQQQQFQFAKAQFNSFKNQPIYTMPQQPQPIEEQVQLIQLGGQRPMPALKPELYSSAWRPVTSSDESAKGDATPMNNDGFDDEFGAPAARPQSTPMNRHPVLSSFMADGGGEQTRAAGAGQGALPTKSSGTKSAKTAPRAAGTKAADERRATGNAPTTAAPPAVGQNEQSSTVSVDVSTGGAETTPASTETTTSTSAETTTEPDSEVLETTTAGEPSDEAAKSTPPATTPGAPPTTSTTSTSAPSTSSPNLPSGAPPSTSTSATTPDSEQATQRQPAESSREETTPTSVQATGSAPSTTTAAGLSAAAPEIEGAAPANATEQSGSSRPVVGTDASLTDEQLLAAAVRASSDLNKANGVGAARSQRLQRPATSTKKARSSGRQTGAKSATSQQQVSGTNKLITKRPQSPSAASRAAKQISSTGTKSGQAGKVAAPGAMLAREQQQQQQKQPGDKKRAAQKQKTTSGTGKAAASGTPKITRMAGGGPSASERLLQAPPAAQQQQQQQQQQFVSMSAAQAQSTAQTLASLLLARCLSSSNCAHLLDVCSTKQAAVAPSDSQAAAETSAPANASSLAAAWSLPVGLMSSNLMSLMSALQADRVLRLFPQWKDTIDNIVDQDAPAGYTLLLPSNEAIDRLPMAQIDALLQQPSDQMGQLIENHILDSAETIELINPLQQLASNKTGAARLQRAAPRSRYLKSAKGQSLQVNQHRDRMVTINGKRVVYANQLAPANGRIHVIDGLLADWPAQPMQQQLQRALDIMETLKQCDKFDGFVTLAEGTGLTSILKQDGPLTVFVPSNEALRKIPDEELEVIKNNSTALREFLMYHIVNGSYFSQDLRDGQQLASILDMRPIQVGIRVDGCSRRLVEANTSPMRKPDIVAKNGVIHILDWYLTVRDNDWCEPIGLRAVGAQANAPSNVPTPAVAGERLQELTSDQAGVLQAPHSISTSSTYTATRIMTNLPPNHKASPTSGAGHETVEFAPTQPDQTASGAERAAAKRA